MDKSMGDRKCGSAKRSLRAVSSGLKSAVRFTPHWGARLTGRWMYLSERLQRAAPHLPQKLALLDIFAPHFLQNTVCPEDSATVIRPHLEQKEAPRGSWFPQYGQWGAVDGAGAEGGAAAGAAVGAETGPPV